MELNKKEITTSADRISEAKPSDSRPPASPTYATELSTERRLQGDAAVIDELCTKERRIHLEFTSRDFHAEQIEDELNLNNINGCSAGCCLDESKCPLDNCHASEALMQLDQPLEIATDFPDLTVDDLEKDALKPDMNVHLVPMEELAARLKDLPRSPDQDSPSPQLHSQPEAADFSTDRIDFFSALEKFVELSQESRSRSCSHSRSEEQSSGRNGVAKGSVLEVPPTVETGITVQRTGSLGNSPQASEDSSTDEEQTKVRTVDCFPSSPCLHVPGCRSVFAWADVQEAFQSASIMCLRTTSTGEFALGEEWEVLQVLGAGWCQMPGLASQSPRGPLCSRGECPGEGW